jgi:prepilin-type N-terminal cleavage/methylation domain-containing protein
MDVRSTLRAERGFSLIEVLVALALLTTMAVGIVPLLVTATSVIRNARSQSSTALLAAQKLEQLVSLTWGVDKTLPGVAVSDRSTDLSIEPPGAGGAGLSASPAGTLDCNTPGYVDYLDAAGQWVGTGASVPARAVYIRRWNIQTFPASSDTLVLQVLVTTVAREQSRTTSSGVRARQPEDTVLVSMKTRKTS